MTQALSTPTRIVEFLIAHDVLRFGDFTLKSGKQSPFFLDVGRIADGRALATLGEALSEKIEHAFPKTDTLVGPAYKGISLATAAAVARVERGRSSWRVSFNRKEAKTHGEAGDWFGAPLSQHSNTVIVDDVVSDGGTKNELIAILSERFKNKPLGVAVIIDRRPPGTKTDFTLVSLITLAEIADVLVSAKHPQAQAIVDFLNDN
jgi:orotate phosphoribosyltransferase